MKKFLSLLLTAVLCCSLGITAFAAEGDYTFTVQAEGSPAVGDTITVTLELSKNGAEEFDLYAMQDYVRFDPAYFSYVDHSLKVYTVKTGELERKIFSASPLDFDEDGVIDRVFVNRASTDAERIASGTQVMQFQLRVKAQGNTTLTQSGVEIFQDPSNPDSYHASNLNIAIRGAGGTGDSTGGSTGGSSGGSSSGGGGGSSSAPNDQTAHHVSVDNGIRNGKVTLDQSRAKAGDTVTLTVEPAKGYALEKIRIVDSKNKEIKAVIKNGKYTFTMPDSDVTVIASFTDVNSIQMTFADVSANAYYAKAVKWAAEKGITGGTGDGNFNPNGSCTRAHIVTFLWRAAGSPEPKSTVSFADVPAGSYYAKAVAWAVENGITLGTTDVTFSPNAACTRAQSMTFLYRASEASASGAPTFYDVAADAYYAAAVKWATDNGITNGIGNGLFGSNNTCTRAQIVTFLWRSYAEK